MACCITTLKSDRKVLYGLSTPTDQPSTRVHPQGWAIKQSWAERQYEGDALSEDFCCDRSGIIYQRNVYRVRRACELFLSLLCGLFHPPPSPTGWLRLTISKTAPLINIWAARRCLSSPSMSWGSPFLSLGQVPGHGGLFEARLPRWY